VDYICELDYNIPPGTAENPVAGPEQKDLVSQIICFLMGLFGGKC
jgi:hypothetical protein